MEPFEEFASMALCKIMDFYIGLPAMMRESAINYFDSNHCAEAAGLWEKGLSYYTKTLFNLIELLAALTWDASIFSPLAFHRQTRAF